ncbi:unnamed protein product [Nippostrongylus brasiliensis]|uniref:Growth-regulating factor n=1 Tax=Nippostrongylus brasiliensis TaxID=27835 RepID=A0A0N4XX14_NIPBR|nr:unnamed protein product [Nippostrongylus brasiliensis]
MDQPELAHHVAFHVHEEDHDHLHLKPPAITHPSLNRIVSGLFHVDTALRTPHASCGNLQALHQRESTSASNMALQNIPAQTGTLRKSNSAVDWSGAMADTRRNSKHYGWHGALCNIPDTIASSSQSTTHLALSDSDQQNDIGPIMSSSSGHYNMAVVNAQISAGVTHSQGITSSASLTQPPPTAGSLEMQTGYRHQNHGVFGGVFHRGFFSKPVIRSEEENYRYLMALDR